jgi:hypothetical protein
LKFPRIYLADTLDDFHSRKKRLESFAIDHMQLGTAAEFTSKLVKGRLEIIFAKENARQV